VAAHPPAAGSGLPRSTELPRRTDYVASWLDEGQA